MYNMQTYCLKSPLKKTILVPFFVPDLKGETYPFLKLKKKTVYFYINFKIDSVKI